MSVVVIHGARRHRPAHRRRIVGSAVGKTYSRPGEIDRAARGQAHRTYFKIAVIVEGPLAAIGLNYGDHLFAQVSMEKAVVISVVGLGFCHSGVARRGMEVRLKGKGGITGLDRLRRAVRAGIIEEIGAGNRQPTHTSAEVGGSGAASRGNY